MTWYAHEDQLMPGKDAPTWPTVDHRDSSSLRARERAVVQDDRRAEPAPAQCRELGCDARLADATARQFAARAHAAQVR
jgi:hypothetical protein